MPESTNIGAFRTKAKVDIINAVLWAQSSDAENPPQNLETHGNPKQAAANESSSAPVVRIWQPSRRKFTEHRDFRYKKLDEPAYRFGL